MRVQEMQQMKSCISYSVGYRQFAQDRLPFIQVIPVCLFLAHDQNYDAIFRSQYEEGGKNTHKFIA